MGCRPLHALPRPLRPCQPSAPFNRLQASGIPDSRSVTTIQLHARKNMIVPSASTGSPTVPVFGAALHAKEVACRAPGNSPGPPSTTSTVVLLGQSQCRLEKVAPPLGTGARDPHIWLSSPRISFVTLSYAPLGNYIVKIATCGRRPAGFEGPSRTETRLLACASVDGPTLATSVRPLVPHLIGKLGRLARCRPLNRAPTARHGVPTLRASWGPAAVSPRRLR